MSSIQFGLNRFDMRSPEGFADSVAYGEKLGFDWAFIPSSPLLAQDPYVNLAFAASRTSRIGLGPLLENPITRHPAVLAGSIATIERLAPGRALLGLGVGDTAVRTVGARPARVARLEAATQTIRRLVAGDSIDPAKPDGHRLRHAKSVPVWICAGGPKTLRMAGRVADGVFIRVGTHRANLEAAVSEVREGAREAGRNPDDVQLGVIFHTVLTDDEEAQALIGRAVVAGYYEYAPYLLERTGQTWDGPDVDELKKQIWQDFHHTPDLMAAGELVHFLSDEAVAGFCLAGTEAEVASQITAINNYGMPFKIVVPHPMLPKTDTVRSDNRDYMTRIGEAVIPAVR
ncbi:MAG: LLM class flavin-dependent oxidoreductase [Gammaproteobacteria bacterium]|nr:LLM class flavin-dependent oxidoreductase [Gammaproteobacteria bacterium]